MTTKTRKTSQRDAKQSQRCKTIQKGHETTAIRLKTTKTCKISTKRCKTSERHKTIKWFVMQNHLGCRPVKLLGKGQALSESAWQVIG